jgi:Xaa-Pro aminopeptidase
MQTAFSKETYIERRNLLKKKIGSGVLLFLGNEESSMNFKDNWYPFRQDSTFLYFFGLDMPGLTALIDLDQDIEILFGDDLTTEETIWQGPHPPISELAKAVGIGKTKSKNEIDAFLAFLGKQRIHFLPPYRPENLQKLSDWLKKSPEEISSLASIDFIKAVVSLRSIKSEEEIREITRAVNISVNMHKKLMLGAKPGMKEYELLGLVTGEALSLAMFPFLRLSPSTDRFCITIIIQILWWREKCCWGILERSQGRIMQATLHGPFLLGPDFLTVKEKFIKLF